MIKRILLSFASMFLVWQSYELLSNIGQIVVNAWYWEVLLAWLLNLFITGVFAFAGFAFPTEELMPGSFYQIKDPTRLQQVCHVLRVGRFRRFLLATFWRSKTQRKNYFNGNRSDIKGLMTSSRKAEFGHFLPFVLLCAVSLYLVLLERHTLAFYTILINIIGNGYPILLQRHHRMRVHFMAARFKLN